MFNLYTCRSSMVSLKLNQVWHHLNDWLYVSDSNISAIFIAVTKVTEIDLWKKGEVMDRVRKYCLVTAAGNQWALLAKCAM